MSGDYCTCRTRELSRTTAAMLILITAGSRKAQNVSAIAGDNHDRRFPVGKIVAAEATLEVLTCANESEGEIDRGKRSSSSDEDE